MTLSGDQDPEQDADPGDEAQNVSPAAMLLAEDPLVDHLQGARHGHGASGGKDQGGHNGGSGMGGRGPGKLAHDSGALSVQADMSAQIGVDAVIGQGTQQNDERQDRQQQRGPEQHNRVDEVEGAEPSEEDLGCRAFETDSHSIDQAARSTTGASPH